MRYTRALQAWYNHRVVGMRTGIQWDDAYQRSMDGCCIREMIKRSISHV